MNLINIILIVIVILVIIWTGNNIMNQPNNLTPEWQERFNNVEKFNQFAAHNSVELNKIEIKQPLDGLHIHEGKFNKVFWKYTSAREATIENVIFDGGAFEKVDFSNTIFRNVTFKNFTIANTKFNFGQLDNVKFINCQIIDSSLKDLKPSTVEFLKVKANAVSFSGSAVNLTIKDSDIRDSSLRKLVMPSSVEIENSEFHRNDINGKKMSHFKLIDSNVEKSTISIDLETDAIVQGGNIKSFGLNVGAKNIIIRNLSDGHIAFATDSKVDSVLVENCKNMEILAAAIGGHIKRLHIKDVSSTELSALSSTIDHFVIENSAFDIWDFNDAKINDFILENVKLKNEATITNSTISKHNLKDLKTNTGIKLNFENSNIKPSDLEQ